jgi:hypothetical protein
MEPSPAPPSAAAATPSPALLRALRSVLRPLVRLMIARGLTLPALVEMLKSLLVEVADREFGIGGKPPTDSRVSLVTGVHRKDVSRLRQMTASEQAPAPASVSLGAQLVAVWMGSPHYLDEEGRPLALARFASEGGALSFEALVASVNSDIRSRVVLDEWVHQGLVRVDEDRRVHLNAEAFVPPEGSDDKAFYFGHNLHDHAAAAVHNLLGGQPAFLERSVHYNALSAASVQQLARQSQAAGMKALLAINKTALAAEQGEPVGDASRQRITFGVYFYSEPADGDGPQPAAGGPDPSPGSAP